jgi:NADH-quinone oxidoreductase subunit G
MYVMGIDPAAGYPDARAALEKLDFLVVQDMFLTETARLAHVVLPAVSFAERDGTYTNAERRVQRSRQARQPHGESRPDWMIVQSVAQEVLALLQPVEAGVEASAQVSGKDNRKVAAMGAGHAAAGTAAMAGWDCLTVGEVALEIAERVPGYAGITHSSLAKTGQRGTWGRQTNEAIYYDGTNYENREGIGIQYPAPCENSKTSYSVTPLPFEMLTTNERYPFVLLVQPLLYDDDGLLRNSRLVPHIPEPYAALNKADAQRLGIEKGMQVQVSSAAGSLTVSARIVADVPEGCVLMPDRLPGAVLAAVQTGPRTRVSISKGA